MKFSVHTMRHWNLMLLGPCRSGEGYVGGPTRWSTKRTLWIGRLMVMLEWDIKTEAAA
jgi:hypothetical protein